MKTVKKVPKGWSDYQAAWIPDVDTETVSDDEEDSEDEMDYSDAQSDEESQGEQEDDDFRSVTASEVAVVDEKYDDQMDLLAETSDLEKLKQAKEDKMFPDEMETPQETPARERFLKYRGLESFRFEII